MVLSEEGPKLLITLGAAISSRTAPMDLVRSVGIAYLSTDSRIATRQARGLENHSRRVV